MDLSFSYKKWDSEFFGIRIGIAELKQFQTDDYSDLLSLFRKDKFKLVYLFPIDFQSSQSLLLCKVPMADTKITFNRDVEKIELSGNRIQIESYKVDDQYNYLIRLALKSGEYSRFKLDKNFQSNAYERLYTSWIIKSIQHEIADDVLVCRINGSIAGFVTCKSNNDIMIIGLIAVEDNFRGKGVGREMMKFTEKNAFRNGLKKIEVNTQKANNEAVSFYRACGYKIIKEQDIFHLWIK